LGVGIFYSSVPATGLQHDFYRTRFKKLINKQFVVFYFFRLAWLLLLRVQAASSQANLANIQTLSFNRTGVQL
jgi:hypothetical protein